LTSSDIICIHAFAKLADACGELALVHEIAFGACLVHCRAYIVGRTQRSLVTDRLRGRVDDDGAAGWLARALEAEEIALSHKRKARGVQLSDGTHRTVVHTASRRIDLGITFVLRALVVVIADDPARRCQAQASGRNTCKGGTHVIVSSTVDVRGVHTTAGRVGNSIAGICCAQAVIVTCQDRSGDTFSCGSSTRVVVANVITGGAVYVGGVYAPGGRVYRSVAGVCGTKTVVVACQDRSSHTAPSGRITRVVVADIITARAIDVGGVDTPGGRIHRRIAGICCTETAVVACQDRSSHTAPSGRITRVVVADIITARAIDVGGVNTTITWVRRSVARICCTETAVVTCQDRSSHTAARGRRARVVVADIITTGTINVRGIYTTTGWVHRRIAGICCAKTVVVACQDRSSHTAPSGRRARVVVADIITGGAINVRCVHTTTSWVHRCITRISGAKTVVVTGLDRRSHTFSCGSRACVVIAYIITTRAVDV